MTKHGKAFLEGDSRRDAPAGGARPAGLDGASTLSRVACGSRFVGRKEFYNPVGLVQGGILAAMLDGVMGAAAVSLLEDDESITTLDMKVSYMQSVRDVPLIAEGRVVHRGGSVVFMDGTLTPEDGSLVATATATGRVCAAVRRRRGGAIDGRLRQG